jgi:hypothetical protein
MIALERKQKLYSELIEFFEATREHDPYLNESNREHCRQLGKRLHRDALAANDAWTAGWVEWVLNNVLPHARQIEGATI